MNRLSLEKRALILKLLCEGNSMRACERTVGVSINTVTKLLVEVGGACIDFQNEAMVHLPCSRIQVDEIWSFCYSKAKHVPREKRGQPGFGDVWTWVAMCPDTKLVPCFYVGDRGT